MKLNRRNRRGLPKRGYMLVMCLLVVAIASSISLTLFNMLRVQTAESRTRRELSISVSLVEAGKERAIAQLIDQPTFRGTIGPQAIPGHPDRSFTVQVSDGSGSILINSSAQAGGTRYGGTYTITSAQLTNRRTALGL